MYLQFNPREYLYHGTIDIYSKVFLDHGIRIITRQNGRVDFGAGFYLSVGNFKQAAVWARQKAEFPVYIEEVLDLNGVTRRDFYAMSEDFKPKVLVYKIKDIVTWQQLNKKEFTIDNAEWKNYVWNWRNANPIPNQEFDWVFGPLADNKLDGRPNEIFGKSSCNQLSVHTSRAIDLLEIVECREV